MPACNGAPATEYRLQRWPPAVDDPLQAWDAADHYLLKQVSDQYAQAGSLPSRVLIMNDTHGALATCLHDSAPLSWSDSSLAHRAAEENRMLNGIDTPLRRLSSVDCPDGQFDLVLMRIPKTTALMEDQLAKLRPHVHADTVFIAAAMIKHLQKSAFRCLEHYLGPVTTSLAVRKARLLFVKPDPAIPARKSPYPDTCHDAETGIELVNHANVFSREHLDHGARFLLNQFALLPEVNDVIDLGCGNGVLGIRLHEEQPATRIQFIDESYGAVASASINYNKAFPHTADSPTTAEFIVADGLELRESDSAGLILCNPPFHQQHVLGERVALSLFTGSRRCLRRGGELWVVANRHLDYRKPLQRLFGNCHQVAANRKFQVLKVVKR